MIQSVPDVDGSGSAGRLTRKRKLLYTFVVCTIAAVLLFSAGEIYIRNWGTFDQAGWYELTDDPVLFYRLAPHRSGDDEGHFRTQTSQRIRGPWEFESRPPVGARRVLWIGDSACFGCGCDDTQTAPYYFHAFARASNIPVESVNLAVAGYNVRQAREVLSQRSTEFSGADCVVYYHHENDIVNAPLVPLAARLPGGLFWDYEAPQHIAKKLAKRSAVVRRLWNTDVLVRLRGAGVTDEQAAAERRSLADRSMELPIHPFTRTCASLYNDESAYGRRFRDELFLMADLASAINARLILVFWPSRTLLHHQELNELRRALSQWCRNKGITEVDVTDSFVSSTAPELYSDTIHPGPDGQRIIAEAVYKAWTEK